MNTTKPLAPDQLYRKCDPTQFQFNTTAELETLDAIIGQSRAVDAIEFGTNIHSDGYNVFAIGSNGVGKSTAVMQFIRHKAANEPTPDEWCYVHNFEMPHLPLKLRVPPGLGVQLSADMRKLVDELLTVIPATFESDEYRRRREQIENEIKSRQENALYSLKKEAEQRNISLLTTPDGMGFVPLRQGKTMSPDEYNALPLTEQQKIDRTIGDMQARMQAMLRQMPQWQREIQLQLKRLQQEMATIAVTPLIEELTQRYAVNGAIVDYLSSVRQDIIMYCDDFVEKEERGMLASMASGSRTNEQSRMPLRYQVNALVDHTTTHGAPVIFETFPTYQNLVGRIEHISQMGTLTTNFTLIKPGSLHKANGGYLIIEVRQLLQQPYAWEGLKRALRTKQIKIEALGQIYSLVSTMSLEPSPIPLDVKVVLLGEPALYYLLCQVDPDFNELFKVSADFEYDMPRTPENNAFYAQLIGTLARKENLSHFDRAAVARVIEHSSRLTEDNSKLTTHMQSIADVLREANYWANHDGNDIIGIDAIELAIDAQIRRKSRIQERMQEQILRDTVMIDTKGMVVGQINGLSVLQLGSYRFGKPSRITARVRLGKGEVIDVERQVELGGPTHSKGVLILSNFLAARYSQDQPFALSASLVFEQSYAGVDGDSASSAELYCLLSALSELPIKQGMAVTGSVNQLGEIQAIGGVNEKIEGFFDICNARGLTGEQGVVIPRANVNNLMLRADVVAAVTAGRFHVFTVGTVDEGIALLTDCDADEVNSKVVARLHGLAERQKEMARSNGKSEPVT